MAKIRYVEAKPAHRLLVELDTGMVMYINMTDKMETCRFLDLKDEEIFRNVDTDGRTIYWNDGFISMTLSEIYQLNKIDCQDTEQQIKAI